MGMLFCQGHISIAVEERIKEEIATNKKLFTLRCLDIYGVFSFFLQLHSLIVKLALNTSAGWPHYSPANMKDPLSVPGVGWLTLGVCVTDSFELKWEIQMFMYMNRFKIHRQFTKLKQKSNTNFPLNFKHVKVIKQPCTQPGSLIRFQTERFLNCLHTAEKDCSSHVASKYIKEMPVNQSD